MEYRYAVCKSLADAETLNQFIYDLYMLKFPNITMEKWCTPIKHQSKNKWAVPIFHIWIGMYKSPVEVEYAESIDGWVEVENNNL